MKRHSFSKQLPGIAILLLGMIAAAGGPLSGQDENSSYPNRSSGSRALADADSRAEKEAERLVSLPAERIIELLQQEPGLLLQVKKMLVRKAYEALPQGGAYIVYDSIIDDDRRKNTFGLLMSLNMLIETPGGFDYTGADCVGWMQEAGFRETRVEHLVGPDSMVVGIK